MDERRNSASYAARASRPPVQSNPEPYPQKRAATYRRPIEPQPTPPQNEAPIMPNNAAPSNSARPAALGPSANGVSRTSSHRRRQSQQITGPPGPNGATEPLPAAPDVPRGPPPTSYRDPYAPKGSRSQIPHRSYASRSRDPTLYINASRQQPQGQIPSSRLHEALSAPISPVEPQSATSAVYRRDSQGRKPSIPDRSPLQKLEGKLDDISKEERRARILEAELAAQEKAEADRAARRAREAAAKQQPRNVSGPVPGTGRPNAVPDRMASTKRHVSLPAKATPKSPDLGEMGYDLSEPWDPTKPRHEPSQPRPSNDSGVATSGSQRLSIGDSGLSRVSNNKGRDHAGVPGVAISRDRTSVPRGFDGAEQRRQSLQKPPETNPKGLGLYGMEAPHSSRAARGSVSRYDSKRLSKALPPTPLGSEVSAENRRDSKGIFAAQKEMEQQQFEQNQNTAVAPTKPQPHDPAPVESTRNRVGFATDNMDINASESRETHHHHLSDLFHGDHEPDRRYKASPMLEEWRNAPVATLLTEDLDLDAPERPPDSTNKAWWEENPSQRRRRSSLYTQPMYDGHVDEPSGQTSFRPPLYLKCGPLLRYTGIRKDKSRSGREREVWRGSVMIVTTDAQSSYEKPPTLRLFKQPMDLLPPPPVEVGAENGEKLNPAYVDPIEGQVKISRTGKTLYVKPIEEINEGIDLSRVEDDSGLFQATRIVSDLNGPSKNSRVWEKDGEKLGKVREIRGIRLHAERGVTFWRFNLEVDLGSTQARIAYRINRGPAIGFWVPARGESMNIMFHSCNGFSLSVNPKDFCGPDPLWRDVLNNHQTRPFHVMIGGGDQIYNDAATVQTTIFRQWTESRNALMKHKTPFSEALQDELESFYLDRYAMWFSQGLFGMANSQIPMVNVWDDHDIIDGYGSYPHHFMETAVFTGLGAVAFKYYMLFQHQSVLAETEKTEPSWILGAGPGPYIKERSRSVFMFLGKQVAFLGLDCRTERQRDEVMTEDSYDLVFDRVEEEIIKGETKHLIVLLGVPIAYPRLNFLENVLTSRLMDPIKALGRTGKLGNFINKFDGGVEILDDLDDHWTAKHHKDERNWLVKELQHIAAEKSVRVTILGGDVHLAAVGQFYSNKNLNLPKDKDHRYMPNVVSSAIVNTPPPELMADIINKRNKVHHLDPMTDEDMIPLFMSDVNDKKRNNNHLLPRRNWCSIREFKPGITPPSSPSIPPSPKAGPRITRTFSDSMPGKMVRRMSRSGRRESGPPMAYFNNPAYAAAETEERDRPRSRRNSISSLFRRRASVDSVPPTPTSTQSAPFRNEPEKDVPPNPFQRRPTLRKKQKKELPFIDLEGGLDVCLNLEVNQKDPSGITKPYRLLIPTLDHKTQAPDVVGNNERRKSRIGSIFGALGGGRKRPRRTVGDDGYSHSGSEADSQSLAESEREEIERVNEQEERERQRYKVGPRIFMPSRTLSFGRRRRDSHVAPDENPHPLNSYEPAPAPTVERDASRRASAPISHHHHHQPHNSSHSATIPKTAKPPSAYTFAHNATAPLPPESPSPPSSPEPQVKRRSMGGILNQHRGEKFERSAHVDAHIPSFSRPNAKKRESYPPHPAIVGGVGGHYETRASSNDREASKAHDHHKGREGGGHGYRGANAGVGARHLGNGRYEDDDSVGTYSDEDERYSEDSFVPPKQKPGWKFWK